MTDWSDWLVWFEAVLQGAAQPWLICLVLVLTTFLLEDLAIAAGAALAAQGSLSWELAFAAVAGGIALGDIGLYGLGLAAKRIPRLRRRLVEQRGTWVREQLVARFASAMLLARVVPGLRLVTYTACGLFVLPFWPFVAWVALAVTLWTAGLLVLSAVVGAALTAALGIPAPLAVALPIVLLALLLMLWNRRAPVVVAAAAGDRP